VTVLPTALTGRLRGHLEGVKAPHAADLAAGRGSVALPGALAMKYPNARREWAWQWLFPATRASIATRPREHANSNLGGAHPRRGSSLLC
jgi:hypothetical protein